MKALLLSLFLLYLTSVFHIATAQKLLRTDYQTMFTEFPILSDTLMTDKYRTFFYHVNDLGRWQHYSRGAAETSWKCHGEETVLEFTFADTADCFSTYYQFFNNPFSLHGDSITFCGDFLLAEGHNAQLFLKQQESDNAVAVKPSSEWQHISITQPLNKSIDKNAMMLQVVIGGNRQGTTYVKNLNVLIDGRPIDECNPLPSANADHEFDKSSAFNLPARPLTNEEVQRLELVCKVWGLYKYRHPDVRSGQYDWNYQLFRMLPTVFSAKDDKAFIKELIRHLPDNRTLKQKSLPSEDSIVAQVHLNWINRYKDKKKLYRRLADLEAFVNGSPCYCLGYMQGKDRHTAFYNETCYDHIPPSDDGYRILALFRFWNMMYYFHPYLYQMEEKWEQLLPDYIRLFADARDRKDFEEACVRITSELKDAHSEFYGTKENILRNMWHSMYLPLDLSIRNSRLYIKGFQFLPPDSCELQAGDAIVAVNHKPIAEIRKEKSIYNTIEKESADQYACAYASFDGDSVLYTIERNGETMDVTVKDVYRHFWENRQPATPTDNQSISIPDGICYLDLSSLTAEELHEQLERCKDSKGIIFDMRGYPKAWNCTQTIASFLYPHPKTLFYHTYADYRQPGVFRKNPNMQQFGTENPDYYKGTAVVLVNGLTISEAEHVATIIGNAPKGYIIGEPTCGVMGNVLYVPFVSGVATRITGRGVYWNDETCTFPDGIRINRHVYPTPEIIRQGKDAMIEEGVKYINRPPILQEVF